MIDRALKPWLIEVNSAPSFKGGSSLDKRVKTEVVSETLQLLEMTRARKKKYLNVMKRGKYNSCRHRVDQLQS